MLKLVLLATVAVYPGCAPVSEPTGATWHFDAAGNDLTGDGSLQHPWASVQSAFSAGAWGSPRLSTVPYWHMDPAQKKWVWDANPIAPIHPGDELLLQSGTYAALSVGVYGHAIVNPDWVTIGPEPDAVPIVPSISIAGVSKLRVTGLKAQSRAASPAFLVRVGSTGIPTSNIVLDRLEVSTTDDLDHWPDAASMNAEAMLGMNLDETAANAVSCVSASQNHLFNLRGGASLSSAQSLFEDNEVDHIAGDFIDISGSGIAVVGNVLHDAHSTGVMHTDFIQGQTAPHAGIASVFHDILIDRNRLVRQLDPNLRPMVAGAQGIDAFDGDWTHVEITRNTIVTSACWGLSWGSSHYALIAHNSLAWDGWAACSPNLNPFTATSQSPAGSDHVAAVNNIAPSLNASSPPPGSVATANVVTRGPVNHAPGMWASKPGSYGGNLLVAAEPPTAVFSNFDRAATLYDLHLCDKSPAIGAGVAFIPAPGDLAAYPDMLLPAADADGQPFSLVNPSAGAYAYQAKPICTVAPSR